MLETSGYRPEPQTLNISVCDEEGTVPAARCRQQGLMCSRLTVTPAWWPNRCPPAVRNP
ncbi:hypothetical protein ACVXG9_28650 [Escherichia coli]